MRAVRYSNRGTVEVNYSTSSRLWLHLESYTNEGLLQDRIIAIVQSMPDPGSSSLLLRAEPMHVNSNVIVETSSVDPRVHLELVRDIMDRLDRELAAAVSR